MVTVQKSYKQDGKSLCDFLRQRDVKMSSRVGSWSPMIFWAILMVLCSAVPCVQFYIIGTLLKVKMLVHKEVIPLMPPDF